MCVDRVSRSGVLPHPALVVWGVHRFLSVPASIYQLELRLPDAQTRTIDLPLPGGLVGSGPDCTGRVNDDRIPGKWLEVRIDGDAVHVTCLDGSSPAPVSVPVGHWCVLSAGHVRVVPASRTTYQTAVLERRLDRLFDVTDEPGWTDPYLEFVDDDGGGRFPMSVGHALTIGRRKTECDVALSDPGDQISRRHASIEWPAGQPVLRDYSTNGTFWRRPPEQTEFQGVGRDQPLCDGDLIRIGSWTLRFRWPHAALAEEVRKLPGPSSPMRLTPGVQAGRARRRRRINWTFLLASTLAVLCFVGIAWLLIN